MADEPTDVQPESSPGDEPTVEESGAESSPVTTDVEPTPGPDRPFINYQSETNRKIQRLERMVGELVGALASGTVGSAQPMTAPTSADPARQQQQYGDEELLELMAAGNKDAAEMYVQRQVDKRVNTHQTQARETQSIMTQLQVLYAKYPMLNDATHPLTQASMLAKQALTMQGRPNTHATDLEAIKIAIIDNPAIVGELAGRPDATAEAARRSATRPQSTVEGTTYRRPAPTATKAQPVSDKEATMAKRYGIKDPAKAKKRFLDRQQAAQSAVSPQVAMIVNEQEGT